MNKYVVIGNPVEHSKSPVMHRLFAEQVGVEIDYQQKLVAIGDFAHQVDEFRAQGGQGASITVPFKIDAYHYADELTTRAQHAGAVSVMKFETKTAIGDNLDGAGLVADLTGRLGWSIKHQSILIIGAGGATRGALYPLAQANPKMLLIANRTPSKAVSLARDFADLTTISAYPGELASLQGKSFDLVINATSASLLGEVPDIPADLITTDTHCYDMVYSDQPTTFMRWAADLGCKHTSDGLGMLVAQGALSFEWWFGKKPDTAPIYHALRSMS